MKKIKVLLTTVNVNREIEEMGICYITAYLREKGYEVKLIAYCEGDDYYYDQIREFKPDVAGMCVYNETKKTAFKICNWLREEFPNILISLGGAVPSINAVNMLEEATFADFLVRGEGEITFGELVDTIEEGKYNYKDIKGLVFRGDKEIVVNPDRELISDLNILPFPSRDILEQYKLNVATLSSSRGCTKHCSFCLSPSFWRVNSKCKWRGIEPKRIVDEIEYLVEKYNVQRFDFIDNSFEDPDLELERITAIATEIVNRNLNIVYMAEFRASFYKRATPELMDLLKKSGLVKVFIGIEAANRHDLITYNKGVKVEDNYNILRFFAKYDINTEMGFINFNPYSTLEGLRENIPFFEEFYDVAVFPQHSIYFMGKECALYNKLKRDNLLKDGDYDDIFGYKFADERVGVLAKFIYHVLRSYAAKYNDAFVYLAYKLKDIMAIVKKHLDLNDENDQKLYQLIQDHLAINKQIIKDFNEFDWYRELIDLAETGWDEEKAHEIVNIYLEKGGAEEAIEKLRKNRDKLFFRLVRSNPKLADYLRWY